MGPLVDQAIATLLVSLRIAPALGFMPPFTLLRIPATVRLLLAVGLAAWIVSARPGETWQTNFWSAGLILTAAAELFVGLVLALTLMLAFAALQTAGRTIDIQAGFGLATLIDPATRAQVPLAGTLFAYAAGAIFFLTDGPADLLALWSASLEQVPLGAAGPSGNVGALAGYMSAVFLLAFGVGGVIMLVLFLIDLAIAFMSRTLPQMNVLLLGFQVKTLAMLILLPIAIALSSALLIKILRFAIETALELL